jgi:hypothetical protein
MVRTLLLTVAFALMTRSGAQLGTLTLAANQLLLQAFMVCVSLLDGFAVAAEVHGAHAIGAQSRAGRQVVRRCAWLSLGWSSVLALGMALLGLVYLPWMTPDRQLQQLQYWIWLVVLPPVYLGFFWDGVFMGAMRTAVLRNGMLLYLPALLLLQRLLGNHGIWAALLVLMAMRGILLTLAWPRLRDSVGSHCIKQAAVACCGSAIISAQSAWMVTLNKEESALQASIRQVSQRVAAELQARGVQHALHFISHLHAGIDKIVMQAVARCGTCL